MRMKFLLSLCLFLLSNQLAMSNSILMDSTQNLRYSEDGTANLNKSEWKIKAKDLRFDEDTIAKDKQKPKEFKAKKSIDFTPFKYLLLLIAIGLIVWVLYSIIKNFKNRNLINKPTFIYNYEAPEKEELLQLQIDDLLNDALIKKNYALAYRLKYLHALKSLVLKNIILYKKHSTNYELMLQIKPKEIQDLFKKLTFNFDGIWYGEMLLTEQSLNELMLVFNEFETLIKNHK